MVYLRPESNVFKLFNQATNEPWPRQQSFSDMLNFAQKHGIEYHTWISDGHHEIRIISEGYVLDSNNGGKDGCPCLFIRPYNESHDHWLRYDPKYDALEVQNGSDWNYIQFEG